MLFLFLVIFILAALIVGIGDYLKKEKERKEIVIDYLPYGSDERSNARKELRDSKFYKIYTVFNGIQDTFCGISIICAIAMGCILFGMLLFWSPQIDEKIALYEEENIKIETQIATVVNQYQEFELNVITECAPESAMTLVSLYPDLKSDTLVAKQIDTYIRNNEKIKELKEEKINQQLIGWWFNFNAW